MNAVLHVQYFDTDASSYTHRLNLALKAPHSLRVGEGGVLEVEAAGGTTHFVPLISVKQYYESAAVDGNVKQPIE